MCRDFLHWPCKSAILKDAHSLSCHFFFRRPKFKIPISAARFWHRSAGKMADSPPPPPDRTAPGIHQTRLILRVGGCPIRRWLSFPLSPFIEFSTTGRGCDLHASSRPFSPLLSPHVKMPPANNIIVGNGVQSPVGHLYSCGKPKSLPILPVVWHVWSVYTLRPEVFA